MKSTLVCLALISCALGASPPCRRQDVVLVMDVSDGLSAEDGARLAQFNVDLMKGLPVSENGTRVAAVVDDTVQWGLTSGTSSAWLEAAMKSITGKTGTAHMHVSLRKAKQLIRAQARTSGNKIIAIVTDGLSDMKTEKVAQVASSIHKRGIQMIILGIGEKASSSISSMSIKEAHAKVIKVENYKKLAERTNRIIKAVCLARARRRPQKHEFYDMAHAWTIVNQEAFPTNGRVEGLELFVCRVSKGLRLGIFRPVDGKCSFTLIHQLDLTDTVYKMGYQKISLPPSHHILVAAGDHLGFVWTDKGVVCFQKRSTNSGYCSGGLVPSLGSTVHLTTPLTSRVYLLRALFRTESPPLDTQASQSSQSPTTRHQRKQKFFEKWWADTVRKIQNLSQAQSAEKLWARRYWLARLRSISREISWTKY